MTNIKKINDNKRTIFDQFVQPAPLPNNLRSFVKGCSILFVSTMGRATRHKRRLDSAIRIRSATREVKIYVTTNSKINFLQCSGFFNENGAITLLLAEIILILYHTISFSIKSLFVFNPNHDDGG